MLITLPLDSASSRLWWSNVVYVAGAAMTFVAAMFVFLEKRLIAAGKRERTMLITEFIAVGAAIVSFIGTIGAIRYGNLVSSLKDADLSAYRTSADLKIAQAELDTAAANQKAQEAHDRAVNVENENLKLQGRVSSEASRATTAEQGLAKANKENSDFAHALQQQQGVMAEQAKVSPVLNVSQIQTLAAALTPFKGQDVILHSTADTTVGRTKVSVAQALQIAGITFQSNSIDMGMLYQGVSVAVHSPQDVPPLATALVMGLRQSGIDAHPVAEPSVPAGRVALYFGPN